MLSHLFSRPCTVMSMHDIRSAKLHPAGQAWPANFENAAWNTEDWLQCKKSWKQQWIWWHQKAEHDGQWSFVCAMVLHRLCIVTSASHSRKPKNTLPNKTCETLAHTVSMQSHNLMLCHSYFKKSLKCNFHTFRCPQSGCSVSSPVEPLAVLHCVAAKPCCQKAWQIVKGGPEVPSEWQCECKDVSCPWTSTVNPSW